MIFLFSNKAKILIVVFVTSFAFLISFFCFAFVLERIVKPVVDMDIVFVNAKELFSRNVYFASELALTPIVLAITSNVAQVRTWVLFFLYLMVIYGTQALLTFVWLTYASDYCAPRVEVTIGYSQLKVEESLIAGVAIGTLILLLLRARGQKSK
jgi:hypothetical protein